MKIRTAWVVHCILIKAPLRRCREVPCSCPNSNVMNVFSLLFAKIKLRFLNEEGVFGNGCEETSNQISRPMVDVDSVNKYQGYVVHITYTR